MNQDARISKIVSILDEKLKTSAAKLEAIYESSLKAPDAALGDLDQMVMLIAERSVCSQVSDSLRRRMSSGEAIDLESLRSYAGLQSTRFLNEAVGGGRQAKIAGVLHLAKEWEGLAETIRSLSAVAGK